MLYSHTLSNATLAWFKTASVEITKVKVNYSGSKVNVSQTFNKSHPKFGIFVKCEMDKGFTSF